MASTRSALCIAIDSSAARAMWAPLLPRLRPSTVPRAAASQYGAPSPVKAGTSTTPPLSGTLAASASTSAAFFTRPSASRSHCTTAPPMNTLPSSA